MEIELQYHVTLSCAATNCGVNIFAGRNLDRRQNYSRKYKYTITDTFRLAIKYGRYTQEGEALGYRGHRQVEGIFEQLLLF